MAYLVRKINVSNWPDGENTPFSSVDDVQADAITNDLKTDKNEISWWKIEDLSEMELAGASFVSTLQKKQSGVLRFVAIPFEETEASLQIVNTPEHGRTAVKSMKSSHYDIQSLNYGNLAKLIELVARSTSDKECRFIKTLLVKDAIKKLKELKIQDALDMNLLGFAKEEI